MNIHKLKKIIKENVAIALKESNPGEHYKERLYDRFISQNVHTVGYEIEGSRGTYEKVGTYILPELSKQNILDNAKLVEDYKFPRNKSYGIKIADVIIDKNQVKYYNEDLKNSSKNKVLVFIDDKTQSNGNVIYLIVRTDEIQTIYFAKSYVSQDAVKMRVDVVIKNMDVLKNKQVR